MSRTANAIKMLRLLSNGRKYSKKELAEKLNTNIRNIYELKKELQDAGYWFEELPGRNGGYALDQKALLCLPKFTNEEIDTLKDLYNRISSDSNFIGSDKASEVLNKILFLSKDEKWASSHQVSYSKKSTTSNDILWENYNKFKHAIDSNKKIEGEYASFNSTRKRVLNPYELAFIDNRWYVTCFEEGTQRFKVFKLDRFSYVNNLQSIYWKDHSYKSSDYFDEHGLVSLGEARFLKLRITGPYMKDLRENKVGTDVQIEDFGNYIIYSTWMRGEFKIREFILKMGEYCQVVEPKDE